MARSNAASRVSEIGAERRRSIDALICDFASSATAAADQPPIRTTAPRNVTSLFIDDERMQHLLLQLLSPVKKRELDHERDPHDLSAELPDQP